MKILLGYRTDKWIFADLYDHAKTAKRSFKEL